MACKPFTRYEAVLLMHTAVSQDAAWHADEYDASRSDMLAPPPSLDFA